MHYFSGLYKKMCEKAVEIQKLWGEKIQTWDEYCRKGDREDGFANTVSLGGMPQEEIEELIENNVWLPLAYQIRDKLFRTYGLASIRELVEKSYSEYIREYFENKEKLKKIKGHFEGDEISNALALMFVMEGDYKKQWNYEKEEWIEIK